jgi:uncharacterized phage protein gp47/JayE
MEIPGVSRAWCYPLRRGLGAVDVVVLSASGLPSAEVLAAVQTHIDELRPVACREFRTLAPEPLDVDVTVAVRLAGATLATVQTQLEQALAVYFRDKAPGDLVVKSRIEAVVSGLPGVVDRVVTSPAANVQALVDAEHLQWPRLGAVTVEAM